jgi:hypothetical protein
MLQVWVQVRVLVNGAVTVTGAVIGVVTVTVTGVITVTRSCKMILNMIR